MNRFICFNTNEHASIGPIHSQNMVVWSSSRKRRAHSLWGTCVGHMHLWSSSHKKQHENYFTHNLCSFAGMAVFRLCRNCRLNPDEDRDAVMPLGKETHGCTHKVCQKTRGQESEWHICKSAARQSNVRSMQRAFSSKSFGYWRFTNLPNSF